MHCEDSYSPPCLTHPEAWEISSYPLGLEPGSAVPNMYTNKNKTKVGERPSNMELMCNENSTTMTDTPMHHGASAPGCGHCCTRRVPTSSTKQSSSNVKSVAGHLNSGDQGIRQRLLCCHHKGISEQFGLLQ